MTRTAAITCPEYMNLRVDHEVALRHWGDLLVAQREELAGSVFQKAVELRKNAADDRDAANKRLGDHKRRCQVCTPKLSTA
jgi:hypothetical protein